MNTPYRFILTALPAIAGLSIVSCSSPSLETQTVTTGTVEAGVPGGRVAETTTVSATVTGIDAATRRVSLVTAKGEKFTVTAGPNVANFHQIRVGDRLSATLIKEVTLRMAAPGETIQEGSVALLGAAKYGARPGAVGGEAHQFAGTVTALNLRKHTATLRFSDGSSTTLPVRSDVDLSQRRVGERVVVTAAEVLAIGLDKP